MAKTESLTIELTYDMKEIKNALRTERMWYLEAFRQIESALDGIVDYSNPRQASAMGACRDRIGKLEDELCDNNRQPTRFDEYGHYGENNPPVGSRK